MLLRLALPHPALPGSRPLPLPLQTTKGLKNKTKGELFDTRKNGWWQGLFVYIAQDTILKVCLMLPENSGKRQTIAGLVCVCAQAHKHPLGRQRDSTQQPRLN